MYFCIGWIYLQSFLLFYFNQTLGKCHEQTGCLSLSGTEIVKDRPDTLSIHGPPVCLSQTSHRPSDAMRAMCTAGGFEDGSESFSIP